jgi:16S rRNA (uracil1498-N3)-methyltransferase
MASPWFFVEVLPGAGSAVALDPREAKHALGARRLGAGDEVVLFDGRGGLAKAAIEAGRSRAGLAARVLELSHAAAPARAIHLAAALPKGDRSAVMLSMATQLGMKTFTPLRCARSEVEPGPGSAERWQRIMIEACKQSRRPFLPRLHRAEEPLHVLQRSDTVALFAHPGGASIVEALAEREAPDVTLLVGPEGGFTQEEVRSLTDAVAVQVDLGPGILRIETAAALMVGAAMLRGHESAAPE